MIMAYGLSRMELVCLERDDVDFDNNTITIYPISKKRTNQIYYKWSMQKKVLGIKRTKSYELLKNGTIKSIKIGKDYKTSKYNVILVGRNRYERNIKSKTRILLCCY